MIKQPTTGTAPSPRGLHAAALASNHQLVVFGGAAQDGNMSNEVFLLDLKTWNWTQLEIIKINNSSSNDDQQQPSPRASPCFNRVDDHSLILFGGAERTTEGGLKGCDDLWLLELLSDNQAQWTRLETPTSPPGRNAATLTCLPASSLPEEAIKAMDDSTLSTSQFHLLSGGWAPFQTTYNDNFVLKLTPDE